MIRLSNIAISCHLVIFQRGPALRSRVIVLDSKEAAEEEAEQNLKIVFKFLIDTLGWGGVVLKVVQGVTQVRVAHWGEP